MTLSDDGSRVATQSAAVSSFAACGRPLDEAFTPRAHRGRSRSHPTDVCSRWNGRETSRLDGSAPARPRFSRLTTARDEPRLQPSGQSHRSRPQPWLSDGLAQLGRCGARGLARPSSWHTGARRRLQPLGWLLVTAGQDTDVHVWNARDGRPVIDLTGQFAVVSGVSFSPDGRWIVSRAREQPGSGISLNASGCCFSTATRASCSPPRSMQQATGSRPSESTGRSGHTSAVSVVVFPGLLRLADARLAATGRRL